MAKVERTKGQVKWQIAKGKWQKSKERKDKSNGKSQKAKPQQTFLSSARKPNPCHSERSEESRPGFLWSNEPERDSSLRSE
jgi:hypothetical protein